MKEKPGIAPGFQSIPWTVAAYNAGGYNLKRATGYRKGMSIEEARAFPAAYALARHVQHLIDEFGSLCAETFTYCREKEFL